MMRLGDVQLPGKPPDKQAYRKRWNSVDAQRDYGETGKISGAVVTREVGKSNRARVTNVQIELRSVHMCKTYALG